MQYREDGYLPEALVNYLARLGWSHGDEEVFASRQFVEWFDLAHVSRSAAQFNPEKLRWLNQQYMKQRADADLAGLVAPRIERDGGTLASGPELAAVVDLFKERSETLEELAEQAMMFYASAHGAPEQIAQALGDVRPALEDVLARLSALSDWRAEVVMAAIQRVLDEQQAQAAEDRAAAATRSSSAGRRRPISAPVLALAGKARVLRAPSRATFGVI